MPVRVKKTRQNKKLEPRSEFIGTEKAPGRKKIEKNSAPVSASRCAVRL
jgi:hypothetical protein